MSRNWLLLLLVVGVVFAPVLSIITPTVVSAATSVDVIITASGYVGYTPWVTTDPAASVGMNSDGTHATLNGQLVDLGSNTTDCNVWFEWGYDTNYGTIAGYRITNITGAYSHCLQHFDPRLTVHYRFVGENPGGVTNGTDQTFHASNSNAYAPYAMATTLPIIFVGIAIMILVGMLVLGTISVPALVMAVIMIVVAVSGALPAIQSSLEVFW